MDLARTIARNGPLAVVATKWILTESRDWTRTEALTRRYQIYESVRSSEDAKEGARAFKQKRPPKWRGR